MQLKETGRATASQFVSRGACPAYGRNGRASGRCGRGRYLP